MKLQQIKLQYDNFQRFRLTVSFNKIKLWEFYFESQHENIRFRVLQLLTDSAGELREALSTTNRTHLDALTPYLETVAECSRRLVLKGHRTLLFGSQNTAN